MEGVHLHGTRVNEAVPFHLRNIKPLEGNPHMELTQIMCLPIEKIIVLLFFFFFLKR